MKLKMLHASLSRTDDIAARLVAGLHKIGLATKTRPWRRTGLPGVGPLQVQALRVLHSKPAGVATVTAIARELSVKLPTASEVIKTLEEKQLVRRRRSSTDSRVVMVHLTSKGKREGQAVSDWPSLTAAAKQLSAEEQAGLLRTLMKLIRTLQLEGDIQVARMCVSCQYFRPNAHANAEQPHHCQFVDAPFGNRSLRIDCPDYVSASAAQAEEAWKAFRQAPPA